MIDAASALTTILTKTKKLTVDTGLELLTYKRDRGLRIWYNGKDMYTIKEFGFEYNVIETNFNDLKKLIKTLLKREFPRSKKIRVREIQGWD
ncbi:hypothetical protein [Pseudodesulfovibrio sediminis]|uniref:Uncharacterized protein n=1 Tax=Pseudodesulfovibrio sediminis TaxID=2810563 RepID=A0ABM7P653_9BACT|nr:hypothetical protein [Pseudodesulfovibrio sediminis]BCS88340.1 hypothetical protein PSDVSF_15820 [Pseudodesulfovibrio sediminis]